MTHNMSKKMRFAKPSNQDEVKIMNWSLCALCQEQLPGHTLTNPSLQGYETLATNLELLYEMDSLPQHIDITRLNSTGGIKETLILNNAKWHKNCYKNCSSLKIERAKRKQQKSYTQSLPSPTKHHLRGANFASCSLDKESFSQPGCFFCDGVNGELHKAATHDLDYRVRSTAEQIGDSKLLTKLATGDMVAIDAVYHLKCLNSFYNLSRSRKRKSAGHCKTKSNKNSLAFAEVVSYIEEEITQSAHDQKIVFKLSDLKQLYNEHLENFGEDSSVPIHSSRFTQRLLHYLPYLEAHNSKCGTLLSLKKDIGNTLLDACNIDSDNEAILLMRVAKLIRKEMFQHEYIFNGSLTDEQYDNMPDLLETLIKMILGDSTNEQPDCADALSRAASSITQLIVFNSVKRSRTDTVSLRHNLGRETVLPLYIGLLIYNTTRKRNLIDTLFNKGLSVSYERVLQFTTALANSEIQRYEQQEVVCPSQLRNQVFTTGCLDNIDHNPSSTLSKDSFHGTAISVTQHVTNNNSGEIRDTPDVLEQTRLKQKIKPLPTDYTDVPPVSMVNDMTPSSSQHSDTIVHVPINTVDDQTQQWLENTRLCLSTDQQQETNNSFRSWSAFFASLQQSVPKPPAITSLLPLFRDAAHTPAMVKHGMHIIKKVTLTVNPDQTPVMTVDQPLYAIAKKIQWKWPALYGEKKFVVLMGGLHIEMAVLKVLGDWLKKSGWTHLISTAKITTEDRAESLLQGSQVSRCQWAHQVTASALYNLMCMSYDEYKMFTPDVQHLNFEEWCLQMVSNHPQFSYWYKTLKLQLIFLRFLRAQREQNYQEYVASLLQIVPWMFALDHFHYSRWMAVHVTDLLALENNSKDTYEEFLKGNFVTQKTNKRFSGMAHDQVHEQLNAMVKGDGGMIGITENDETLRRWMVAGPETARLLSEYSNKHNTKTSFEEGHHEQISSVQNRFASDVKNLFREFEGAGNPFSETSKDLYTLDTKQIMPDIVKNSIESAEDSGQTQFKNFVSERIHGNSTPFFDAIPKNNIPLFSSISEKRSTKCATKISNLNSDVNLFSRLYIASQTRESDMDNFFAHENHPWPPSLASNGIMHSTCKSDLIQCLESVAPFQDSVPDVDAKIVDGAALVHSLEPKKSNAKEPITTFKDYADYVFIPSVKRMVEPVLRLDVVWDTYKENSLKQQARQNRGSGTPMKIEKDTKLPANWKNFLRCDKNKESLFKLLAIAIKEFQFSSHKQVISTFEQTVVSSPITRADVSELNCTHEEADTRLLFHAKHIHDKGLKKILIQATDTDVVVIAITVSSLLEDSEIWVAFGHGNQLRYIPCHLISSTLGTDASRGLLLFHALTGCDVCSSFHGIGKKTAWNVLNSMPHLHKLFADLSQTPNYISSDQFDQIERFTILLYQRTSELTSVNDLRKQLFSQLRNIENVPPSKNALEQHVKRAVYQAGFIWGQTLTANPTVPSPEDWGWMRRERDSSLTPYWTDLPEASKACRELIKCGCKTSCIKRWCSCVKANLPCSQLCFCSGQCYRE